MNDELLKYAVDNGMINLSYVQEQIEMTKRNELLKKHPYKIWEGKDGKWYTYLPDKEKGRILKKRSTKKYIEDIIISYLKSTEIILIETVFDEWLSNKLKYNEIQKQTYDRYKTDFYRFFYQTDLVKKDIRKITEDDLENFIRESIRSKQLSRKAFSGLRLILIGIFKYAKKCKYTEISITQFLGDLELPKKCFSKNITKAEESVFTDDEVEKISVYIKENISILN